MAAWSVAETCRISTLIMSANSVRGSRGSFGKKSSSAIMNPASFNRPHAALTKSSPGTLSKISATAWFGGSTHVILQQNLPGTVDEGPLSAAENVQPQEN